MLLVKDTCSTEMPHTVADPDLQIRGGGKGGHPDPEIRGEGGWSPKKFFRPPGTSPRSATAIERGVFAIAMIYHGGNYSAKSFRSDSPIYMDICYLEKMSLLTIVWINADFSHRN